MYSSLFILPSFLPSFLGVLSTVIPSSLYVYTCVFTHTHTYTCIYAHIFSRNNLLMCSLFMHINEMHGIVSLSVTFII